MYLEKSTSYNLEGSKKNTGIRIFFGGNPASIIFMSQINNFMHVYFLDQSL